MFRRQKKHTKKRKHWCLLNIDENSFRGLWVLRWETSKKNTNNDKLMFSVKWTSKISYLEVKVSSVSLDTYFDPQTSTPSVLRNKTWLFGPGTESFWSEVFFILRTWCYNHKWNPLQCLYIWIKRERWDRKNRLYASLQTNFRISLYKQSTQKSEKQMTNPVFFSEQNLNTGSSKKVKNWFSNLKVFR